MRVALLAESFLPHMNGVTNSVLQVLRHLEREGHDSLVLAPRAANRDVAADPVEPPASAGQTTLLRSLPLPSYPDVRVALARAARLTRILKDFRPDVLHLASPFVLGWQGLAAADALRVPTVAVYQTDVIAYAERYGLPGAAPLVSGHVARLHRRATVTLAPSSAAEDQLAELGVDRVRRWARGVDADRFSPERRSAPWRARIAPGELLVGFVGRLAPEKQVADLRVLCGIPGVRLVVIGDGPARGRLEAALPDAVFTGFLGGDQLAEAMASLDVFVHPGESETFCQTVQEALASGVPVVATGRGGPVDLVRSSVDGWLYRPGDLDDLRLRVTDLTGDPAKRAAFATAARKGIAGRTWASLGTQLLEHYDEAQALRPLDDALTYRAAERPALPPAPTLVRPVPWQRYVALGDSLTEGLCDTSRMPAGRFRGWADRLAPLLAHARGADGTMRYANLAVRSRRIADIASTQLPAALALRPDLVSMLIGANDLVKVGADPVALACRIEPAVRALRAAGADVLLVTPFLPTRRAARLFTRRFARYAAELRRIARDTGARLLDTDAMLELGDPVMWAPDRVHLSARGHRLIAYRAAAVLDVPDAEALGDLDEALHVDEEQHPDGAWLRLHALPWVWRRMRGRAAGDGLEAKHSSFVTIGPDHPPVRTPAT